MTTTHEVLTGICACCLGRFVVEGRAPVLHGYKRPGDGAIRGNCQGMRFPAYEVAADGCVYMRDMFKRAAEQATERARALEAGEVVEIATQRSVYRNGRFVHVPVTLTPSSTVEELRAVHQYSWADLVKAEASRERRNASAAERHAAQYQAMIDAWRPGLEFISEERLNADKAAVRADKQAAAAQKRRFKAYKAVFFHLGAAIAKHKRGWLHSEWEWEQIYVKAGTAGDRWANVSRLAPFAETYPSTAKRRGSK